MLRLLSRGRKAEDGDNEPKNYKKANLGQANQMYYNEELKMWVEKGKEEEARAEKAKLSAPPPSSVMGTISATSSNTSLATMSDAASVQGGPSVPDFSRRRTLKDRYVSTIPTAPAAGTGSAASPAAPPSQALFPGMGGPKLPGLPGLPGSGPPSFFQPTPAASEAGEMNGGSNLGSMSGLSGLDASFPGSRNASQPNFFMPGPAAPSSSTTTEDTQGAGGAADSLLEDSQGMRTSSGSGAAVEQRQSSEGNVLSLRQSSEGTGMTLRESDTSGSSRVPAVSGPSIVSLAAWRPPSSPDLSQTATSRVPGGQHVHLLQQQGSSADMEADARAEVSSPTLCPVKQQQQPGEEQHSAQEPWAGASGAGDSAAHMNGFGSSVNAGAGAAEPLANGNHSGPGAPEQQHEHGQQLPQTLSSQLSVGWDHRPARDPFDAADEAPAASTTWGAAEGGGYGWEGAPEGGEWGQSAPEGGEWGQSYPTDYSSTQQQPQDPLAVGTSGEAGAGWGQHQYGDGWGQEGGWGNGVDAAAVGGAADPEGGAASGSSPPGAAAADANGWQQPQAADGQQPDSYYNHYGMQYGEQYGGQQDQQYHQYGADAGADTYGHQYGAEAGADMYGQQYAADQAGAVANGDYQQSLQDGAAAYSGYQQQSPAAAGPGSAAEQRPVEVLEPVHPELPGISVAGQGSGSVASPTYAPPGSSGSKGSRGTGRLRHASTPGSPLTHQSSVGALLPQPPRFSVGGVGTQQSLGVDGQAEAAAVILSPQAAAGDPSMLTTIRPSSPYARAVSPLSRTSTGIAEAVVSKQSSGGFPIPSPPSHGGLLGSRATSGIFIPGSTGVLAAGVSSSTKPWQPSAQAEASAAQAPQFLQPQHPMQEQGLVNGYDPTAAASHSQWHQEQQEQSLGLWHQQQQQQVSPAAGSSSAAQVPPFMPGLLESLPRLDAPTGHDKHDIGQRMSASGVAAGLEGCGDQLKAVQRAHPYDQFLAQALSQVNWQAVHFKQPGKLNKLLPWEELEMEKALAEEAQQQESGQGRKSPFWYRQMEFRQKLPPGSMKPSASEPAAMPSHAGIKAIPASAADSAVSQNSAHPGWPQQRQQLEQEQEPQMVGSPLTPARAATTGALGAVAPGGLEQQAEEPTPTSKLVPAGVAAAASAAGGEEQAAAEGQQQGWAGWTGQDRQQQQPAAADGYWQQQQPAAADGYWQQQQQQPYAQQAYAEQQSYDQHYDAYGQYAGYGQQSYAEQQQHYQYGYDSSQWQQQQPTEGGVGVKQMVVTQEGVSTPAAGWGGTWGSPVPEALETSGAAADAPQHALEQEQQQQQQYEQYDQQLQQQHLDYSAAAADEAAGVWGADDAALDLQLAVAMPEGLPAAAGTQQDLHAPEVVAAARAARISTSSLGLESQPSTGRVAAAAAKRIVSEALDNIMQQQRVPEEDADQQVAEAAVADGWEGGEEHAAEGAEQQAAEAGDSGDGYADESGAAAANLPAAWVKLAQQFAAAADAADAMGALGPELAQYRDYFVQYGDYLLGALPHAALEQAGLLVEEPVTAAAAAAAVASPGGGVVAAETSQQLGDEDQEEFFAEFGSMQIKNDISAGLFSALGYDIDSLLACCSEA